MLDIIYIKKKPKKKECRSKDVNDCDLSLSKQTNKDFCATTRESWFFRLGKCENNVEGMKSIVMVWWMINIIGQNKAKPEKFNPSLTQIILNEAYL